MCASKRPSPFVCLGKQILMCSHLKWCGSNSRLTKSRVVGNSCVLGYVFGSILENWIDLYVRLQMTYDLLWSVSNLLHQSHIYVWKWNDKCQAIGLMRDRGDRARWMLWSQISIAPFPFVVVHHTHTHTQTQLNFNVGLPMPVPDTYDLHIIY